MENNLFQIIQDYQENQRRYHQNIQQMLDLIERQEIRIPRRPTIIPNRTRQRTNENVIFNWMRYYLSNRDQGLQDVIVRPTDQQIENATELILYDSSIPHSQCSITLEPFEEDEWL